MLRSIALAITVSGFLASTASAQYPPISPPMQNPWGPSQPIVISTPTGPVISMPPTRPLYPPVPSSYPVIVAPQQPVGVNRQTGGIDTAGSQVNNTAYDRDRFHSQFNGTKRYVSRPVRDRYGRIVGYQKGWVWNNSRTGQEHGDVESYTPNKHGGVHSQGVNYMVGPKR